MLLFIIVTLVYEEKKYYYRNGIIHSYSRSIWYEGKVLKQSRLGTLKLLESFEKKTFSILYAKGVRVVCKKTITLCKTLTIATKCTHPPIVKIRKKYIIQHNQTVENGYSVVVVA